jgi:hypothetical protein
MIIVHINQKTRTGFILQQPAIQPFTASWFTWLRSGSTSTFGLYDDNPIDDEKLCTARKDGDTWTLLYQGHKKVYMRAVGTSDDMTYSNIWSTLRAIWNQVSREEGGLRRQH